MKETPTNCSSVIAAEPLPPAPAKAGLPKVPFYRAFTGQLLHLLAGLEKCLILFIRLLDKTRGL